MTVKGQPSSSQGKSPPRGDYIPYRGSKKVGEPSNNPKRHYAFLVEHM